MKIALITDLHIGYKGGTPKGEIYSNHFRRFYEKLFFPYLEKNDVRSVICLGDTFDKRKSIDIAALKAAKEYLFNPLDNYDYMMLIGNHDMYYREVMNGTTSPEVLLSEYNLFRIIDMPVEDRFGKPKFLYMPWICQENYDRSMELLSNSDADICLGHFEIAGFKYNKHVESHGGLSQELFKKFKLVCSGHYHTRNTIGNITYLGNPYELTWADWDDPRGFHILDTDTLELEFIKNPYTLFHKIRYQDDMEEIDFSLSTDKIVRIVRGSVVDKVRFDKFLDKVNESSPIEVKIDVEKEELTIQGNVENLVKVEDTQKLIRNYIDNVDTELDKNTLSQYALNIYEQAIKLK